VPPGANDFASHRRAQATNRRALSASSSPLQQASAHIRSAWRDPFHPDKRRKQCSSIQAPAAYSA
jgi:hypothetical protein